MSIVPSRVTRDGEISLHAIFHKGVPPPLSNTCLTGTTQLKNGINRCLHFRNQYRLAI
jgi:hypothetical protein